MRKPIFIAAVLCLAGLAGTGAALPPIVIYNVVSPAPVLQVLSIVPANHQELRDSPGQVTVSFSQPVDVAGSTLTVYDPYNNPIARNGPASVATALSATLPKHLLAGTYREDWSVKCACAGGATLTGTSYFIID